MDSTPSTPSTTVFLISSYCSFPLHVSTPSTPSTAVFLISSYCSFPLHVSTPSKAVFLIS